ncbi:MAG: hypothetical protein HYZ53_27420 [Planctomycetes bacterium]|nr:hypothetical protein [Planctomycetota bacterium]
MARRIALPFRALPARPARAARTALSALFVVVAAAGCSFGQQTDPARGDRDDRELARLYNRQVGPHTRPADAIENVRIDVIRYEFAISEMGLFEPAWREVGLATHETLTPNGLRIGVGGGKFAELLALALPSAKTLRRTEAMVTIPDRQETTYTVSPAYDALSFEYQDAGGIQKKVEAARGRLRLRLAPECLPDRKVRLTLTPSLLYFDGVAELARPFNDLTLHLSVADGEAIVLGSTPDPQGTLGGAFFRDLPGVKNKLTLLLLKPHVF